MLSVGSSTPFRLVASSGGSLTTVFTWWAARLAHPEARLTATVVHLVVLPQAGLQVLLHLLTLQLIEGLVHRALPGIAVPRCRDERQYEKDLRVEDVDSRSHGTIGIDRHVRVYIGNVPSMQDVNPSN